MKKEKNKSIAIQRFETDIVNGLTLDQVSRRKKEKLINKSKIKSSKSYLGIIIQNTFTYFNLIWAIIIFAYIYVGSYNNLLFVVVILLNTLIAIYQECKAKRIVEKLSLVTAPKTEVIRDGVTSKVLSEGLVLDDLIVLNVGNQIPADSILISGYVEMNESLLTGESNAIKKREGEELLAGSFVVAGTCYARVNKIGNDSYIQTIAKESKKFKSPSSDLFKDLNTIIKYIGIAIIPIAVILYFNNMTASSNFVITVTKTCGALTGMVPAGMFLLVTIALAVGVVKLSQKKTLVQDLYSIEMLARTNVLCLDKTGTITDGTMQVTSTEIWEDIVPVLPELIKRSQSDEEDDVEVDKTIIFNKIMASYLAAHPSGNQTSQALIKHFGNTGFLEADKTIPFSSERKHSGVYFKNLGTFFLGAPEFVSKNIGQDLNDKMNDLTEQSQRVLLLSYCPDEFVEDDNKIYEKLKPYAIISIEDHIREDAIETINWFKENDVKIKIISGDNAATVSAIAKRVGVEGSEHCVSLEGVGLQEISQMADRFTIFGRVSPEQKHALIKALKNKGYVVAMTGDGVNDTLALKEADCSVAMADGSDVARNISNLVLMDSKFSSLPAVVREGRQVVNNIQKSSTLFLMKTLFSFLIAFFVIVLHTTYPFESVQLLLLEMFVIGLPSLILALEPNGDKIKGSFIPVVLKKAIPSALLMFINVGVVIVLKKLNVINQLEVETLTVLMLTFTGVLNLLRITYPYTPLRAMAVFLALFFITLAIVIIPEFFGMYTFSGTVALVSIIILACSIPYLILMPKMEKFINKMFMHSRNKNKLRKAD
ncbi:MAG: HAD-IC family P-type ATPase [Clostridia bacterium]|nr:HAD-IC family P-type ATPase [Clostridia bacterium]MDD4685897.1 HAD-IC family P-type ATPase [Clostridia bacterium]